MTWFLTGWEQIEPRLRRFALINTVSLAGSVLLVAVITLLRPGSVDIREVLAVLLVASVVMTGGLALAPVLREAGVAFALLAAALVFSFGVAWTSPFLSPLAVLVLLVPLIVAYPYVGRRTLAFAVGMVIGAVTAVTALAESRRMSSEGFPIQVFTLAVSVPSS